MGSLPSTRSRPSLSMHVLFVEPAFPKNQQNFVHALTRVGARVTAIGESPPEALGPLRRVLHGYERVPSVVHEPALLETVRRVQEREWVDRLEATIEAHQMAAAHVREATSIPGTTPRTAYLCRDKPAMKEVLRAAGIACAQSTGTSDPQDVRDFVDEVGYPIILKPRDGAGAAGTYKANDAESLERALEESGVARGLPVAVEEFNEGHEGFYDTISVEGQIVHDFVSHYYPNVLEAMRERWISPQIISTNQVDDARYEEVKELGRNVIAALGIGTSATHMEWFFGPKGLRFSEIGCRPPGVSVWDIYGAGNGLDLYEEWAKAIVHGRTDARATRQFATGMIALRPDRDGRIVGYEGWEAFRARHGGCVIDHDFPPPGTPTQPVAAGYMANAWVRLRHPDADELRSVMDELGETVEVRAS